MHVLVALAVVIGLAGLRSCRLWQAFSLFETANNTDAGSGPTPKGGAEPPVAKVAINAIVGPPEALAKQLQQEFTSALEQPACRP